MKKKINLVTFNIKNLKKKLTKKKLYLIGTWCFGDNFEYKKYKLINAYNWNSKKKIKEEIYLNKIYKKTLSILSKNLNKIHKETNSLRYWQILLNRWLMAFLIDTFSKWQIVNYVNKHYEIRNLYSLNLPDNLFIPENTEHHNDLHKNHNEYWNHWYFKKIFFFKSKNFNQKFINNKNIIKNVVEKNENRFPIFKKKSLHIFFKKKIFFYDTAFDKILNIIFFIKNLFFIFFYKKEKIVFKENNNFINLRENLAKSLKVKKSKNFFNFCLSIIKFNLPKTFLENYKELKNITLKLNWPKNPDFICTSYGHYYDELFKMYCAIKLKNKSKFFIFQHGANGFSTNKDFYNIGWNHIADKYFSWGNNSNQNHSSFFYTKKFVFMKPKLKNSIKKKILIIGYGFNNQPFRPINGFYDQHLRNLETLEKIKSFLKKINVNLVDIKILDVSYNSYFSKELNKIFKKKILDSKKNYIKLLKNYNLTVHFTLSTPFFESILFNKPSILIYEKKNEINFNNEFKNIFKKMYLNNLIFLDSASAVKFINKNFKTIENWWNSKNVQNLLDEIKYKYCNNHSYEMSKYKSIFNK